MTALEVSRRERKKDETRERITRAAMELFVEKGFAATTVDEIAERADVAKGTFFNHFPRKEAVLGSLAQQHLQALHEGAEQLLANPELSAREMLIRLFLAGAADYQKARDLWLHLFLELMRGPVSALVEVDATAQEAISRVIAHGQSRGEFRTDVPADRLAYVSRGVFFFTALSWFYCPELFDLGDELKRRLEITFDGFRPLGAAT